MMFWDDTAEAPDHDTLERMRSELNAVFDHGRDAIVFAASLPCRPGFPYLTAPGTAAPQPFPAPTTPASTTTAPARATPPAARSAPSADAGGGASE